MKFPMRPELPTAANVQAEFKQPARRGQLCIFTTRLRFHLNIGDCCSDKRGHCCAAFFINLLAIKPAQTNELAFFCVLSNPNCVNGALLLLWSP